MERDALKARGKVDELKTIQDLLSRSAGLKKNLLKKDEVINSLTRQIEMMSDEELLQKEYAQLKMENEFLKQDAQSARDKALAVKSAYEKELAELQVQIDVIAEKEAEVQRLYETESLHIDTLADIKASHMKASLQKKYENVINAQKLSHRNQLIKQQQKYLNIIKFLFAQTLGITVVIVLIIWLPDELNFVFLLCLIIFLIIQALYIRIHKYTLFSKYPRQ